MDLTLNLDLPVNLKFGSLTTNDLLDLRAEVKASGIADIPRARSKSASIAPGPIGELVAPVSQKL
ncbi:MAG TPA: hypothetical protein VFI45_14550 [Candidatus Acidoferrum sp.]|nr:hypothetical protein [Candidatus Acidoferrum sp.]